MLLREKLLVGLFMLIFTVGMADLNTPHVNLFWERYLGFSGRFMVLQGEKVGYVNARSRLMIAPQFDGGVSYFDKDLAPVAKGARWGFIDVKGRWAVEPQYLSAREFKEDLAAVSIAPFKYGFLDRQGQLVIPASYADAGNFCGGIAPVKSAGSWGYINRSGQWAIAPQFEEAKDLSEGLGAVKKDGQWGFVQRNGFLVIKPQFDDAKLFHDGRAPVKAGTRWGYIDARGQWVVKPQFSTAGIFSDGLAAVDQSGYIDPDGNMVIQSKDILSAHDFSQGLAAVQLRPPYKQKSGKWGYIDRQGRWIIQPRFEIAKDFEGGMARVSKDKNNTQRGYIHHNGKLVWDPADWEQTLIFKGLLKTIGIIVAVVLPFYILFVLRQREKQFYFLQTIS